LDESIYELTWRGGLREGTHRQTGERVRFAREPSEDDIVARVGFEQMLVTRRAMTDPRLARIVSESPLVFEGPPARKPKLDVQRWCDLSVSLLELLSTLVRADVTATAWTSHVTAEGELRVMAPAHPPWFAWTWQRPPDLEAEVTLWLKQRLRSAHATRVLKLSGYAALIGSRASASARATFGALKVPNRNAAPRVDPDRVIALAEAHVERSMSVAWAHAAALHHRGCVRLARGEPSARADLEAAARIDAHPRYLTSLGLLEARRGDDAAALAHFDFAVAGGRRWAQHATGDIYYGEPPPRPEEVAADRARALHARGALRARRGELEAARDDLEAATKDRESGAILSALGDVYRRLGEKRAAKKVLKRGRQLGDPHAARILAKL